MPDRTRQPRPGIPDRRPLQASRDAWESVVRQELARLRRHGFKRSRMTPGGAGPTPPGTAKPPAGTDETGS